MKNQKGIVFVGNILTDHIKIITDYPKEGMLTNIIGTSNSVGGCVPNTSINLAKIDNDISISVCGLVGNDEDGRFITAEMKKYGIDTSGVKISDDFQTSYSDAMSVESTGARTFFHHRGANRKFSPADIDLDSLNCEILHIGYILLLDEFDREDREYGTVMARFLKNVQEKGIKTSIDVVSDTSEAFKQKVVPALKYCNYAIMNEIEGGGATGIEARRPDGSIDVENIKTILSNLMEYGVKDMAVIHCPEAGFSMTQDGEFTVVPSLKLPKGFIKGSCGAGDAFCAGCLCGIYNELSAKEILEFASCAAVCNLTESDAIGGMRPKEELFKMNEEMERQVLS